jgi:NADH-quinone oxidoreductase subunit K
MVPVNFYIILSAVLFAIGALGVLIQRNPLIIFMSIELMLNSANLAMVAFSSALPQPNFSGQIFVFFVIAVAAAEVAVGLALIVEIFKTRHSVNVDEMNNLKG